MTFETRCEFGTSGATVTRNFKSAPPQNEAYLRAHSMIGFCDLVREMGHDPIAMIEEAGLPVAALTDHDLLIPYRRHALLLELAARRLGRPAFALEWACAVAPQFHNLGPLTLLEYFTATFREWIDLGIRSISYHTNGFNFRKIPQTTFGQTTYRYAADSFVLSSRQQTEHIFALTCMLARRVTNLPEENPLLVRFSHSAPTDLSLHQAIFGCKIEFDASVDELVFSDHLLDARTNGNLSLLQPLIQRFIRYRIDHLPLYDQSARMTVALTIPSVVGTGNCNIEFIAEALGLSVKQLQRQLASEGTNFSEVLDEVRRNMAMRLLTESHASIERIGGLLDYSSTPAFSLAFKRWAGVSPLQYRKQIWAAALSS
ncbi:helix-turn-helix protein [Roseinatronobacter thiooxidans]|uniref:Helix-turn-helix protein n=1 Tax=Roseinatronobacter thiooxidans TaxID=121821 RepID=A0A2W7QDZ3_9RHOB|nr:helix-turn-helix protein [Roseinatronobacter thiooxidans]